MKKIFLLLACAVMMVACNKREALISDYEKACEKGQTLKAQKLLNQMEKEWGDEEPTPEQLERIENATLVLTEKSMQTLGGLFGTDD